MLNGISFSTFLITVVAVLVCYYAVIIMIYYRKELHSFLNHRSLVSSESIEQQELLTGDEQMAELTDTVIRINTILDEAGKESEKPELLNKLKEELSRFSGLDMPAWKALLYHHVINETSLRCGVTISEEELDRRE